LARTETNSHLLDENEASGPSQSKSGDEEGLVEDEEQVENENQAELVENIECQVLVHESVK
jgi:hypothetical protein